MNKQQRLIVLLFTIFLIVAFLLTINVPFFWDGMMKAGRASWIYDNKFSSLIVPTEINSGHPPLWITSLAVFWTIFGKTLWAARLLLLLVNWGVFYQLFKLCLKLFDPKVAIWCFFLVGIEATLIAQTTNLNNDMMLLFFVLFAINALLSNKWLWYTLALAGVLMTNLRGLYCTLALLLIHILLYRKQLVKASKMMVAPYLIGLALFVGFAMYQYSELGWAIISTNKSYLQHRQPGTWEIILHNIGALGFHVAEFGRIFLWLPLMALLIMVFKTHKWKQLTGGIRKSFIILLVFTGVFVVGFVPFTNPIGPRYLMICYIIATILLLNLVFFLPIRRVVRRLIIAIVAIGFITGHLWVYPAAIDQAWDSNLAYLHYYKVRDDMFDYIDKSGIPEESIGTHMRIRNLYSVPALKPNRRFGFTKFDMEENPYILFSNIENWTTARQIETLRSEWIEVQTFSQMGVFVTLYKNPKHN